LEFSIPTGEKQLQSRQIVHLQIDDQTGGRPDLLT
jgi:hypothetical protein